MDPDNLSRIESGVSHRPQVPVDNSVDNYSLKFNTGLSSAFCIEFVPVKRSCNSSPICTFNKSMTH